ncbi:MAG: hypothetical protein ACRD44_13850 [Bryobacteraceae bacterium]
MLRALIVLLATIALPAQNAAGRWTGASANGDFNIALEPSAGDWKCEVTFTFGGTEVKTKVTNVKVSGAKVEAQYEFDLGGNILQSTIQGELAGGRLKGTYSTVAVQNRQPVDQGDFEASKVK